MVTDDAAAARPRNSGLHLNCRQVYFAAEHAPPYFAFMYQEMQTTQLYQLLRPLRYTHTFPTSYLYCLCVVEGRWCNVATTQLQIGYSTVNQYCIHVYYDVVNMLWSHTFFHLFEFFCEEPTLIEQRITTCFRTLNNSPKGTTPLQNQNKYAPLDPPSGVELWQTIYGLELRSYWGHLRNSITRFSIRNNNLVHIIAFVYKIAKECQLIYPLQSV